MLTFLLLDIGQTTSLSMNILNLARGLCIKVDNLLTGWGSSSLFVIRGQTGKERVGLLGNAVGLINTLSLFSGMVLAVEVIQGGEEAARNSMLLVKVNSALSSGVFNDVTMCKIFCNPRA